MSSLTPSVDTSTHHDPGSLESPPASRPSAAGRTGWFRAFWRWHFYASFLVIPILLMLALTGLIYLFRFQVEPLLHADLMRVKAPTAADAVPQPYAAQLDSVQQAFPESAVLSMTEPAAADHSTRFSLETETSALDVFVDPWTGEVLGSLNPDTTLSGYAVRLHGDLMAGPRGDLVIELGACWAIVMALTGYYLFVRGRAARLRRKAAGAANAALRQRHALVGAIAGFGLLFLLVSGLPWTGFWGEQAQAVATQRGSSLWGEDPGAISDPASTLDESLPHSHDVPWALQDEPVPTSDPGATKNSLASVDTAVYVGAREGLQRPMTVALPDGEEGVFSVLGYAFNDPAQERTVHVDQFGGQVVSTYGYQDYPVLAKVVAQGISLHEGRRLGVVSFWGTAAFCLGVVFLCVTGPLMWWRRRPRGAGSVGAPRGRLPLRTSGPLAVALVALGLFLPVFGLSVLILLLLDQLVLRRVPVLARWFDVTP